MSIAAFIRDSVLRPRLQKAGCLVVYDPESRYRELCAELAAPGVAFVDAATSSIESRRDAILALSAIAQGAGSQPQPKVEFVLIHVPARKPVTDEQKQVDPFAVFAACGAAFPSDEGGDGDEYLNLCLRARPDHATEIRKQFAQSAEPPGFAVIDAIGGGVSWPQLRVLLGAESAREILVGLLSPTEAQLTALNGPNDWVEEARAFLQAALGMKVKSRAKTWSGLADEIWRFVLFSEFAFDLPSGLPESLQGVPHADAAAHPVIDDTCDSLRTLPHSRQTYRERALAIEQELALPGHCSGIVDLGARDTFPFEERSFLHTAIEGIASGDMDRARDVLKRRRASIWLEDQSIRGQWDLVAAGIDLMTACEDGARLLPEHQQSQATLLDFYLNSLREVDRLQREFEQAVSATYDPDGLMADLTAQVRSHYGSLTEKVQAAFVKHLASAGWPPQGRLANADVFDRLVGERLKEGGRRTAYLMVDALRYELGVALEKQLAEDGPVEIRAAYAQLPTITLVGMASLLPGAGAGLSLSKDGDKLQPRLDGQVVANVPQRMAILSKRLGDRFQEMTLRDFVNDKPRIADEVDLLVLRSTEIDSQLESNPETALKLVPDTLKLIRVALHRLRKTGFQDAVIATDHGFFLNAQAGPGDVCVKPPGTWPIKAHDRLLLGDGSADSHSLVMDAGKLGIRGDFAQAAVPRSMAPYQDGHLYFHGGASLAEAVVPVLIVGLKEADQAEARQAKVELIYRKGAKRITSRRPVVEVAVISVDMFAQAGTVEILVEAQNKQGEVVGEARPGGDVDPASRTVSLATGKRAQVTLVMDEAFEGKFTVKALNPATLASYASLNLETDYTV